MIFRLRVSLAVIAMVVVVGCSGSGPPTKGPEGPAATTIGGGATGPVVDREPCAVLSAEQVGAIVGMTPVEVAERADRGDCDYWLNEAKDAKVNIGVLRGPYALAIFESTKDLGSPEVASVGDESYSINNESLGTVVVARKGDSVVSVQVLGGPDTATDLAHGIALAEAVVAIL